MHEVYVMFPVIGVVEQQLMKYLTSRVSNARTIFRIRLIRTGVGFAVAVVCQEFFQRKSG